MGEDEPVFRSIAAISPTRLICPVLKAPSFVVRAGRGPGASGSFYRGVLGPDGAVRGYGVVCLVGERVRVYVSEQPPAFVAEGLLPPRVSDVVLSADPDEDGTQSSKRCRSGCRDNQTRPRQPI